VEAVELDAGVKVVFEGLDDVSAHQWFCAVHDNGNRDGQCDKNN
jgi:hypothetical protein